MSQVSPAPRRRRGWRRRLPGYLVIVVLLAVIGTVYAALAPRGDAATGTGGSALSAIVRGRQLFLLSCASCHGLDAQGGARAPSLIGVGAAAVDFQVSTGRMPLAEHDVEAPSKPPLFDRADTLAIAAFIASLAPGPAIPASLPWQSANSAEGGELFRTNCSQCHNVVGSGGTLAYGKFAPGLGKANPRQIWEAMVTGPENMPNFTSNLTTEQKLQIIKFVRTTQTEANPGGSGIGRVGPVSEGLVVWLVGIGLCAAIAMWIGTRAAS